MLDTGTCPSVGHWYTRAHFNHQHILNRAKALSRVIYNSDMLSKNVGNYSLGPHEIATLVSGTTKKVMGTLQLCGYYKNRVNEKNCVD